MRMKYAAFGAAFTLAHSFAPAEARPISYPGGVTLMQMNTGDYSSVHAHYSPTYRDSIGLYSERNWGEDWHFTGVQYNRLLKRWNEQASQANLYIKGAVGQADAFGAGDTELAGFVGVAADWETRRWFTSYEARAYDLGFDSTVRHAARIGVAPYIGDYGDLHTWLMLQVENHPDAETPTQATVLARFFYDVQLLEVGFTPDSEAWMLNWIVRF